jgi:hypothetical protein
MILTLLDYLGTFSKEPLLLLMLAFTLMNLLLLARLFFRKRPVLEKTVEGALEMVDEEEPILIEVATLEEIQPVQTNGNVDIQAQVEPEVMTLLSAEEPDACKYCLIFKGLSSIVCPNCGRPLKNTTRLGIAHAF